MTTQRKKITELKRLYAERWNYPPTLKSGKIKYTACGESPLYVQNNHKACWEHPLSVTPNIRFGPCWDYPPERYKRRPLPPPCRGATVPVELLVPSFEHLETLYTRYDFRLEQCVHEQILFIEQLFFKLKRQLAESKELQVEMAERMLYHSTRYRLLAGFICCTKMYPEYLSKMTEERSLCEFQKAYSVINESNDQLANTILAIRDAMPELQQRIDKLDRSLHSPFLLELATVLQTIDDLSNYFFGVACKLKTWAQLMDPAQEHSIEDYLALLKGEYDFESLMRAGTEQCTCKRCDNKNPLQPYKPCWCQQCDFCEEAVKKPIN